MSNSDESPLQIPDKELLLQKCECCGKLFLPGPDDFIEEFVDLLDDDDDDDIRGEEWKSEPPQGLSESDREDLKTEIGLDDRQMDELVSTGSVEVGITLICSDCY